MARAHRPRVHGRCDVHDHLVACARAVHRRAGGPHNAKLTATTATRAPPVATWRRTTTLAEPSHQWRPRAQTWADSGEPTADRMAGYLLGDSAGALRVTARHSALPVSL